MQHHHRGGPTSKPPVSSATLDRQQLKGACRSSLDQGPATQLAKGNRWDLTSSDPAQGIIWALTLMAHEFYQQVCKRSQLELASGAPRTARALLSTYMHMIILKMKLDLDGLPQQWNLQLAWHTAIKQHTTAIKPLTQKSSKPHLSMTQTNPSSSINATI